MSGFQFALSRCMTPGFRIQTGIDPSRNLAEVLNAQAADATTVIPRPVGATYMAACRTYMFVVRVPDHGHETTTRNNAIGTTYHSVHGPFSMDGSSADRRAG